MDTSRLSVTAKEICDATGANLPKAFSLEEVFPNIATIEKNITKGCLYIPYMEFDKENIFNKGAKAIITDKKIVDDRIFIIEDIFDAIALFRPGPMKNIPTFLEKLNKTKYRIISL